MIDLRKNQSGQSLLEMLVAIFILVVALTATIVLVVTSINAGRDSINRLTAANLAREGIELVRNIRDSNWVEPTGASLWDEGLDVGPIAYPNIYFSDVESEGDFSLENTTDGFNNAVDARIYYDPNFQIYFQNCRTGGCPLIENVQATNFYRAIYLSDICQFEDGTENIVGVGSTDDCSIFIDGATGTPSEKVGIRVVSEVRWPDNNSGKKVQIEERLYNWQSL